MTLMQWIASYMAGPILAALIVGGLWTWLVLGRVRAAIEAAVGELLDSTYEQVGGVRDSLRDHVDDAVERIDSTAGAQHDQTRRILEHRSAYTGSQELPVAALAALPTVADGQAAADAAQRRAREAAGHMPWDHRPEPGTTGQAPRAATSAVHIGEHLAERVRAGRQLARPDAVPPPDPDSINRDPRRAARHSDDPRRRGNL